MKKLVLINLFLSFMIASYSQEVIKSCIITIENGKAYLDITSPKVKVGDVLSVREEAGYMIHPVTKKKIKKEGGILADLEIVELANEYSVATIFPEVAASKIKTGMYAEMPELKEEILDDIVNEDDESEIQINAIQSQYPIFNTAEDVLEWHYKSTGFKKLNIDKSKGQLVEKEIIVKNKKGKEEFKQHFIAITHKPTERMYINQNLYMYEKSFLSNTIVINGVNGWEKRGKKAKTISDKHRLELLNNFENEIENYTSLNYYNQLIGEQYIDGKKCIGIRIENRKQGESIRNYYDISNGWLVASYVTVKDKDEVLLKVKGYKNFGGIMYPSELESTDKKGRVTTQRTIRYNLAYPLDNILFTEDDCYKTY